MTDERYVYNTDIRERRSAASGARAKKGGSRSKRCTLPSDHLTPAQKRKLNGQPETVNLNRPMTYAELKHLTPTLQFLYLDTLVSKHRARRVDILEMLGCCNQTFYLLEKKLPGTLEYKAARKPRPEWVAFMSKPVPARQEAAQDPEADTQAPAPVEPEDAPVAPYAPHAAILAGSITVRCAASEIAEAILRLIDDPEAPYTFTISFTN